MGLTCYRDKTEQKNVLEGHTDYCFITNLIIMTKYLFSRSQGTSVAFILLRENKSLTQQSFSTGNQDNFNYVGGP
jgi:hypothetical protein